MVLTNLIVIFTLVSTGGAAVIMSNLSPGDTYNNFIGYVILGSSYGTNSRSAASSFTTGTSNWDFDSAELALRFTGGSNSFSVNILVDADGKPGTLLQSTSLSGIQTEPGLITITPNSPISLEANKTYWIALFGNDNSGCEWYLGLDGTSSGSSLANGVWTQNPGVPAFRINGTQTITPIPEPNSIAGFFIITFYLLKRRNRHL